MTERQVELATLLMALATGVGVYLLTHVWQVAIDTLPVGLLWYGVIIGPMAVFVMVLWWTDFFKKRSD